MSVVTGLVLMCSVAEELQWTERPPANLDIINGWLATHGFQSLKESADEAVGTKQPQVFIYTAGFNYFPEDEFAALFQSPEWELPENAVLMLDPEDGATRVFRPSFIFSPLPSPKHPSDMDAVGVRARQPAAGDKIVRTY